VNWSIEVPDGLVTARCAARLTPSETDVLMRVEDRRIAFRVGINVGDVIVEPHDIFGDGVNIAARLEGIADPGGICISSSAYDQVAGKIEVDFADLGDQHLKNIARPVRAYAVARDKFASTAKGGGTTPIPPRASRLSMVVLPFANIGGDPEQDYFVDGVTESLTTDLSRIRGLFVIGRHTAFSYKGKSIDLKQIGRELHVLYVLEGSVQRSANQLRVNVQFVDAESGAHLWADRFDKPICDLFEMQDEIVSRLANALNAQLIAAEARRSEHSLHPSALDLYFQCMARWNKGVTPAHMAQARSFFERALELDPDNVEALVGIGAVDVTRAGFFLADGRAFCRGRGGLEQGDILGAAACPCSRIFGFCLIVYQTRDGRHRGMRARVGIKPEFGGGPCFHWLRQSLYRTRQRNRGTCTQGNALVSRDEGTYRWMTWVGFSKLLLEHDVFIRKHSLSF